MKPGQRVVCVKSHPEGVVTVGNHYTIKGMKVQCKCYPFVVDVGVPSNGHPIGSPWQCYECGVFGVFDGVWWLASSRFAPIEEISETTFNDIFKPQEVSHD